MPIGSPTRGADRPQGTRTHASLSAGAPGELSIEPPEDGHLRPTCICFPAVGPRTRISSSRRRRAPLARHARALARALALALGATLAVAIPAPPGAADSAPFEIRSHAITGVIEQVWPLQVSRCEGGASDVLVLSIDGGPPHQRKLLTYMPCGAALRPGDPSIVTRELPERAVVVDVATLPGREGPQLFVVSAEGIRVEALSGDPAPRDYAIPGGLPLPPRPWAIGRLAIVDDWNDDGGRTALVPSLRGAWLVDLASGATREIEMPIYASYLTRMPHLPETIWKWMIQEVSWPSLERSDDNGDGRTDLIALSRWAVWIYHAGPDGLPSQPTRRIELVPFTEEEELRNAAFVNNYFARDLDGDGRADLLLSTIGGGLMDGHSRTRIHLNGGSGVSTDGEPDALRETEGGFSGFLFADLDGDGREEIIEMTMEFGIVQIIRILVTRRAETQMRVLVLDPESPGGTRAVFEADFPFRLDFGEATVTGMIPSLGDWNGDGALDLYVARNDEEIGFRMGSTAPGEPVFGSLVESQSVPLPSGQGRVGDLDGDGLDDIVAFNDDDPDMPLVVLHNRGVLPGTRAGLRAKER